MAGKHAHKWFIYTDDHNLISEEDQIEMYVSNELYSSNNPREWSDDDVREELREEAREWITVREEDYGIVAHIEVPDDYPMDRLRSGEYYDHNYTSV